MLKINGKTFMNLQEAVQWLLDNNALPFQCSANYIANTEIGMGTIVNPSPAKVRIGSLIFFADSKVSTVTGLTENGFICSDQYNNLVDDIAYVTGVSINGSGHLITTLSDGQTIDAGIVKQVSGFSINGSQHLIVSFNDGTSTDLGAIFSGNITISGNLTVVGDITGPKVDASLVTGNEIIEKMTGYYFAKDSEPTGVTREFVYAGIVKTGNKITFVLALNITRTAELADGIKLGEFYLPTAVGQKLYPATIGGIPILDAKNIDVWSNFYSSAPLSVYAQKYNDNSGFSLYATLATLSNLTLNTKYYVRYEATFLLSNSLVS